MSILKQRYFKILSGFLYVIWPYIKINILQDAGLLKKFFSGFSYSAIPSLFPRVKWRIITPKTGVQKGTLNDSSIDAPYGQDWFSRQIGSECEILRLGLPRFRLCGIWSLHAARRSGV